MKENGIHAWKKNDFHLNNDNDLIPKRCVLYNNKRQKDRIHWKTKGKKFIKERKADRKIVERRERTFFFIYIQCTRLYLKSKMINLDQIRWTFKFILHMSDDDDDDSSWNDNLNNNFPQVSFIARYLT